MDEIDNISGEELDAFLGKLRKIIDSAVAWEKLRTPMRYLAHHDLEISDAQWQAFHEVECALAEAVWELIGEPSVPPEAWRSMFKVVK